MNFMNKEVKSDVPQKVLKIRLLKDMEGEDINLNLLNFSFTPNLPAMNQRVNLK